MRLEQTLMLVFPLIFALSCGGGSSEEMSSDMTDLHDAAISDIVEVLDDLVAPSVPSDLSAEQRSATSVKLTWMGSTDNVGVAGYKVFDQNEEIGTSTTLTFTHNGLPAGSTHCYRVKAFDLAGNVSDPSDEACITLESSTDVIETTSPDADNNDVSTGDTGISLPTTMYPVDLAIEGDGTSALVTDQNGYLIRVDLTTMQATRAIASGLSGPMGVAIEAGGETALVAEIGTGRLNRVNLATGQMTILVSDLVSPQGVAIEAGGATALVTEESRLSRVSLDQGTIEEITDKVSYGKDVVIEAGGTTALVVESGQILRVTLASGSVSPVATEAAIEHGYFSGGIALTADGQKALVNVDSGCLMRVDLSTGTGEQIGCMFETSQMPLAIEDGGDWAIMVDGIKIVRVYLESVITLVPDGIGSCEWVEVEASGTSAVVVQGGAWATPRVLRVDLDTRGVTELATLPTFFSISGLAIESGGTTALVVGQGTSGGPGSNNALVRVNLSTGASSEITSMIEGCYGSDVMIESGGATALIPCSTLYRVNLSTGTVTVVVSEIMGGGMDLDSGGAFALVSSEGGRYLRRIDMEEETVSQIGTSLSTGSGGGGGTDVAIEPAGLTAVVTQSGGYATYPDIGRVVRINLETGATTILVPSGLSNVGTYVGGIAGITLEEGGATALVADYSKGLVRVNLPWPL